MRKRETPTICAAKVMLGMMEIEDVPEMHQRAVEHLITRCGPVGPYSDPVSLVVGMMRRTQLEWRR
jgi:hypothetical protein